MAVVLERVQLPQLLNRLEKLLPRSLKVHGDLTASLSGRWPGLNFVVDQWPDFHVVITKADPAKTKCSFINAYCSIYCDDDTALRKTLKQPSVLDWSRRLVFDALERRLFDIVIETRLHFDCRIRHVDVEDETLVWQATEDSLLVVPVPDEMTTKPMECRKDLIETVAANWPYSSPGIEDFVRNLIDTFPSLCLYDGRNNLVGYACGQSWGVFGMVFVKPQYRGQGYGKVIVSQLADVYIKNGKKPMVCIDRSNIASKRLHEKLGFKVIPKLSIAWLTIEPV